MSQASVKLRSWGKFVDPEKSEPSPKQTAAVAIGTVIADSEREAWMIVTRWMERFLFFTRKGSLVALRTWTPGNFWDEALSLRRDNDVEADQPPTAHLADW
jgi:hypothetical protein